MCQMCDDYDAELQRMGLVADAKASGDERQRDRAPSTEAPKADPKRERPAAPVARA